MKAVSTIEMQLTQEEKSLVERKAALKEASDVIEP